MDKQAILDVLNNLEEIERSSGDESYILVANSPENRAELNAVGVSDETINRYGDEETFCILALAFGEKYAEEYDGKLILWGPIDDDFRYRVLNGEGRPTDAERLLRMLEPELYGESKAEFGTFAAHQPGYERFKELGKLDDYVYQALVHMGNASHQWSWANTVLEDLNNVPNELKERIRAVSGQLHFLTDELRPYHAVATHLEN